MRRLYDKGQRIVHVVHDEVLVNGGDPELVSREMVAAAEEFLTSVPVKAEAVRGDSWACKA